MEWDGPFDRGATRGTSLTLGTVEGSPCVDDERGGGTQLVNLTKVPMAFFSSPEGHNGEEAKLDNHRLLPCLPLARAHKFQP